MKSARALVALTGLALLGVIGCQGAIDLDTARSYRCVRGASGVDAGACPFGWHCGVEGFCYSRSDDLNGDAGFACAPDAGDCIEGWFCGHDLRCHDSSVAAAYACTDDSHCVGGWRCGLDGTCLDPTQDALVTDAGEVLLLDGGQVTPRLPWGPVQRLSVSHLYRYQGTSRQLRNTQTFAFTHDGGLTVFSVSEDGFDTQPNLIPTYAAGATRPADSTPPVDLLVYRNSVFTVNGAQLREYSWSYEDGGVQLERSFTASGRRLRGSTPVMVSDNEPDHTQDEYPPLVIELETDAYRLYTPGATAGTAARGVLPDGGRTELYDFAAGPYLMLALGKNGIYRAQPRPSFSGPNVDDSSNWNAVEVTNPQGTLVSGCQGATGNQRAVRIHLNTYSRERTAVELADVQTYDGGFGTHIARLNQQGPPQGAMCFGQPMERYRLESICPICQLPTEQPVDVLFGWQDATAFDEARDVLQTACTQADGGVAVYQVSTSSGGECRYIRDAVDGSLQSEGVTSRSRTSVSGRAEGAALRVANKSLLRSDSLLLDRPPDVLTELGGITFAIAGNSIYRDLPQWGGFLRAPRVREDNSGYPVAVVQGQPSWFILGNGAVMDASRVSAGSDGPPIVISPASSVEALRPPLNAQRVTLANGTNLLVMTAFDALLTSEVDAVLAGGTSTLEVKTVPQPRIPILSLTVLQPAEGDPVRLRGYLLTRNGLFDFRALSDQQWRTREVELPEGQWLEVWNDHERARVGYADGRVFALPSRVEVAPPLEAGEVSDYLYVCGRSYALTTGGLMRLDPVPNSAVGRWSKQEVPALAPLEGTLAGSKLYSVGSRLFAFTAQGTGIAMTANPCPSP